MPIPRPCATQAQRLQKRLCIAYKRSLLEPRVSRYLFLTGVCVAMGLLAAVLVSAGKGSFDQQLENREPQVLAARYHLRTRTPNFYSRAKPNGNPLSTAKK